MTPTVKPSWRRDPILLAGPAAVILIVLFALPLLSMVGNSLVDDGGITLGRYLDAARNDQFLAVVARTVRIALLVTVLTALLGFPFAYTASLLPRPWSYLLLALLALPLATPTLVRSFVWLALLSPTGPIHTWTARLTGVELPQLVYTDVSLVIGMAFVLLPMMVLPLYSRMRTIDPSLVRAATSMGATPFAAWRSVYLPMAFPGVAAGGSIVFLFSLGFYTTPMLLGGDTTPVIAQRIDVQMNSLQTYGATSAEATLMLVAAIVLIVLLRRQLGVVAPANGSTRSGPLPRFRRLLPALPEPGPRVHRVLRASSAAISRLRHTVVAVGTAAGVLFLLTPMVVTVMLAFSDSAFLNFPPDAYSTRWFHAYFADQNWTDATMRSVMVAGVAALIAAVLGTCASFGLVRSRVRRLPALAYVLAMAPIVMPQILYAVALYFFLARAQLIGTDLALVLGYVVLAMPFVVIVTTMVARSLDPLTERAAASLGAPPWKVARDVVLPLAMPGVFASFLFGFVVAFDDLALAVFLGGPFNVTLQVRMFENLRFEISPQVAAVGVILLTATIVLGAAGYLLTSRRLLARLRPKRGKR